MNWLPPRSPCMSCLQGVSFGLFLKILLLYLSRALSRVGSYLELRGKRAACFA